jgi:hypothetical protein
MAGTGRRRTLGPRLDVRGAVETVGRVSHFEAALRLRLGESFAIGVVPQLVSGVRGEPETTSGHPREERPP